MTDQNKPAKTFFQKIIDAYSFTAIMLLSTLICILSLNIFFYYFFKKIDSSALNMISQAYYDINLEPIYKMNFKVINELLKETWSRKRIYIYEPFTQYKERPYKGDYVKIDHNGFRYTKNQGPWPPQPENLNIFLFGGSTTFGYGVSDSQTIASYLQEYLTQKLGREVRVYNFGRACYYSSQELFLYVQLLKADFIPDYAVFIDGLNDFGFHDKDEPYFSQRLRKDFDPDALEMAKQLFFMTSLARGAEMFGNIITSRFRKKNAEPNNDQVKAVNEEKRYNKPEVLDKLINRYFLNKKLIEVASNIFGVQPIFVWQPIPTYHYDTNFHPFLKKGFEDLNYSSRGYARMAGHLKEKPQENNFIWCADIQKELKQPLYVDQVHYSPSLSKLLAEEVADQLMSRFNLEKNPHRLAAGH